MNDKKFGKSNKMQVQKLPTGIEGLMMFAGVGCLYLEVHSLVVRQEPVKLFFHCNIYIMEFAILMSLESL